MAQDKLILGVDIGGTKVAAGLVNMRGDIVYKTRVPMVANGDAAAGLAAVGSAIETALKANPAAHVSAIGMSSPGPLDPKTGVVINPPNLPCWRNFHLADEIRKVYDVPTRVDNDANAAGLAEAIWGAGIGFNNVFYATLGTGIGTGVVFDGKVYHGRTGAAAEGGHMSISFEGPKCGCGKRGCIESLASGPAIAQRARFTLERAGARGNKILELTGGSIDKVTAEVVGQAWRAGDKLAGEILQKTCDMLTCWLGNIVDLLEPDVMVIGGGVGELVEGWFDYIRKLLPKWTINSRCQEIPIVRARYLADSGIAGSAALCLADVAEKKQAAG